MDFEIVIYAPPFDPNSGGALVLHKFCDTLNKSGKARAYLLPFLHGRERYLSFFKSIENPSLTRINGASKFKEVMRQFLTNYFIKKRIPHFALNPLFDTPLVDTGILKRIADGSTNTIIVYPEITNGNPLRAKHVVRWLLHNPGFHTGVINIKTNELHFRFSHETIPAIVPGLRVSDLYLTILHIPWEFYNMEDLPLSREGIAYSLRKGAHKSLVHNLEESILIDDKPHSEVAQIFKRSKLFISYDSRSTYSQFASLCGCDSVIVPDPGVSEGEFFKSPESRYGISYGFEGIEAARETRGLLVEHFKRIEAENLTKALAFLHELERFFMQ